jgi:hypothetical protein
MSALVFSLILNLTPTLEIETNKDQRGAAHKLKPNSFSDFYLVRNSDSDSDYIWLDLLD